MRCPCCQQEVTTKLPFIIDLNTNVLVLGENQAFRLSPQCAEVLFVLSQAYPGPVSYEKLICSLWSLNEPSGAQRTIYALACHLRKLLKQVNFGLITTSGSGYRLAPLTSDPKPVVAVPAYSHRFNG